MTPDEQVDLWVQGRSVHNPDRDECCPDFSCCQPDLLAPVEVRKAFQAAGEQQRIKFLSQFLGALVEKMAPTKDIYVATGDAEEPS